VSLPVSSAAQSAKVLREPIQTTEKWRWKNFSALRALSTPFASTYSYRS